MGYVDLHVHSNASDGTMTPSELVSYAVQKKLDAIALTDHDTISGIFEAQNAAKDLNLEIIPGVELSCMYQKKEIHILGLFIDPQEPSITKQLDHLKKVRMERNEGMICRFAADGIILTKQELQGNNPNAVITRAHFAKALVARGYVSTMEQAFQNYLKYGGSYCLRKEKISPALVMGILSASHAFPVLAHPMQYQMGYPELEVLLLYLKELGLEGAEVYHSSNTQYESMKLKELCKKYGLLPSGGSDFHGSNKPDIDIGIGRGGLRISSLLLDDIKEKHFNHRK